MLPIPLDTTRITESLVADRQLCDGVRSASCEGETPFELPRQNNLSSDSVS